MHQALTLTGKKTPCLCFPPIKLERPSETQLIALIYPTNLIQNPPILMRRETHWQCVSQSPEHPPVFCYARGSVA